MTVTSRSIVYHRSTRPEPSRITGVRMQTPRLVLDEPADADLDALYEICSDPQSSARTEFGPKCRSWHIFSNTTSHPLAWQSAPA
ncbi:hypothetical protein [Rhodococcus sp. Leaf233]|uniref:hypothetical protein n=1 Tax=Rhodococcus sp. Leaf233 TaxID=1736302 RepID=UPI001F25E5D6|nr:hypothetical protein [Rhodococcus sp. Leaf233]